MAEIAVEDGLILMCIVTKVSHDNNGKLSGAELGIATLEMRDVDLAAHDGSFAKLIGSQS